MKKTVNQTFIPRPTMQTHDTLMHAYNRPLLQFLHNNTLTHDTIFIPWHNDLNAILSAHPSILIDHKVTQCDRYFRATKQ